MAFPPSRSIALTTAEAALASLEYVMATFAPSEARRFAIAAPIPREPPVTNATFWVNLDMIYFSCFVERFTPLRRFKAVFLLGVLQASYLMWRYCTQI